MRILVIGSSNTDMIFRASKIPAKGETVLGSSFSVCPGGRGLNQAIAAARAGGKVVFIGRTGNDMVGEQIIEVLGKESIDISGIIRDKDLPSGVSSVVVDENGESAITITQGANSNLTTQDCLYAKSHVCMGDIVLLQLDIPIETVKYAADMVRAAGARVILNPSPALPVSDELLKSISILTPSASQAEILTGITITDERSAELAGRILLERGLNRVIITLRSKGAMVIDNGGAEHVPGFEMNSVDTSVVNDVFNGALVVALVEGKNFYESVLFANAAASLSASRPGTLSSIPLREEILELVKKGERVY